MAYEVIMLYHLHIPSYFLGEFTEYPSIIRTLLEDYQLTISRRYKQSITKNVILVVTIQYIPNLNDENNKYAHHLKH